jgi:hypothetical protein
MVEGLLTLVMRNKICLQRNVDGLSDGKVFYLHLLKALVGQGFGKKNVIGT